MLIVTLPLGTRLLDACQHLPDRVDHRQQGGGQFGIQTELAIPQAGEEALACVRDCRKFGETKKSRRSLDGVNGAENAGENFLIRRMFFELDQVTVKPVEILVTFDQKFLHDVIAVIHRGLLFQSERPISRLSTEVLVLAMGIMRLRLTS